MCDFDQKMWFCHKKIKNLIFVRMHQSFVVPAPTGPGNSGVFNFLVFKALLNALHCEDTFMVKSLLKAPAPPPPPPEVDNNEEQQMTWTIWINFLPLSHGGSALNLAFSCFREGISKHTHTCTHTFFAHQNTTAESCSRWKNMGGGGLWRQSTIFWGEGGWQGCLFVFLFLFFHFSGQLAFVKMYNFLQVMVVLKNAVCSNGICWNEKKNPIFIRGLSRKKNELCECHSGGVDW